MSFDAPTAAMVPARNPGRISYTPVSFRKMSADYDAGHRALKIEPAPEERQENGRAERRAEKSPGIFHEVHDGACVRVRGDHERDDGHGQHQEQQRICLFTGLRDRLWSR